MSIVSEVDPASEADSIEAGDADAQGTAALFYGISVVVLFVSVK